VQAHSKDKSAVGTPFVVVKDASGLIGPDDPACAIIAPSEMLTNLPAEQE
jgi:hypothetical protein